jgi:uncharacterized OB-fold protein
LGVHTPKSGRIGPWSNTDTQFFWDGTREGKLLVQQCSLCQKLRHPPGPACQHCHSLGWRAVEVSGRGELYSYTVLHHPIAPGFDGPALVVVVQLEEGIRFVSNLVNSSVESLEIGEPLEVIFVDQEEGYTLPIFRPVVSS